jgi:hypothetical protein
LLVIAAAAANTPLACSSLEGGKGFWGPTFRFFQRGIAKSGAGRDHKESHAWKGFPMEALCPWGERRGKGEKNVDELLQQTRIEGTGAVGRRFVSFWGGPGWRQPPTPAFLEPIERTRMPPSRDSHTCHGFVESKDPADRCKTFGKPSGSRGYQRKTSPRRNTTLPKFQTSASVGPRILRSPGPRASPEKDRFQPATPCKCARLDPI